MIPFTEEELAQLYETRNMLARKGMNTAVTVLDLLLRFAQVVPQQTAGDDQSPTGTTQSEETSK